MAWRSLRRGVALAVLPVVSVPLAAQAQSAEDITALDQQVVQLYGQGKYAEAIDPAKRSLALAERLYGLDHLAVGTSLNNLAALYARQDRTDEAEPLYKRALAIRVFK